LLGEGFHVQLDYDVQSTEKGIPMFEKIKNRSREKKKVKFQTFQSL
jgi:hypothetical protein